MSDDTTATPTKRGRKANADKSAEKEKTPETKKRTKKVIFDFMIPIIPCILT